MDVVSDTSSVEYQDAAEVFDDNDDVLFVQEDRPKRVPLGQCCGRAREVAGSG